MRKVENIILIIAVIAIICAIIYFGFIKKEEKVQWYLTKSNISISNMIIDDYDSFKKFAKKTKINEEAMITDMVTFAKGSTETIFNEEYFQTKKLAIIPVYEDTSKTYIYLVDKVEYNKEHTEATIYYTHDVGGYAGAMKNFWYNYMIVEIDKTAKDIKFERLREGNN